MPPTSRELEEEEAFEEEPDDLLGKTFAELEADSRKAVLKSFDEWYERMSKLKRVDRLSDYPQHHHERLRPAYGLLRPGGEGELRHRDGR